ncbi:MAG: multidrug resistance efflux transporter family protein [Sarcina sp.]
MFRAFGVTLVSMPLGIVFMFYGYSQTGFVSKGDLVQALILALFSGVIATVTFFIGTSKAKHSLSELAAVESTQAGMVIFTAIGSVLFIGQSFPTGLSLVGMIVIIVGMILNSFIR